MNVSRQADFDLVACGEALIDFTPAHPRDTGAPLYAAHAGGGPANLAVALARLGATAAFIGQVGNDFWGHHLAATFAAEQVDTTGLVYTDRYHTSLAFVHLSADGERDFTFYRHPGADAKLRRGDIRFDVIQRARLFHFSSLLFTDQTARAASLAAAQFARTKGLLVSYDPNWRPMLWPDEDTGRQALQLGFPLADFVKATPPELALMTDTSSEALGVQKLFDHGVRLVLLTRGAAGCTVYSPLQRVDVPSFAVTATDTTGAGDAWLGAFLHAWIRYTASAPAPVPAPDELEASILTQMARFANAAAALQISRYGGIPAMPLYAEVLAFLAAQPRTQDSVL